jgi:multisubunit Na+/H+ antiporter MnhG subunit
MSSLVIDISIWILLIAGAGFGLIGLIGLLIFPDTRCRMYTAVRACIISISATGLAVIIYGLNALQTSGGNQYFTLLLHTLFLLIIAVIGNYVVSGTILENTRPVAGNPAPEERSRKERDKK